MPGLKDYLRGFGIRNGLQLSGYVLTNINGSHNAVITYREYEYPLELTFTPQNYDADPDPLLHNLREMTSGTEIIYSSYGNPYECDFGTPHIKYVTPDDQVVINTIGHAYRV